MDEYQIIMWQRLSGDFDLRLNCKQALQHLFRVEAGDIVVFHDSPKFSKNLKQILPVFLEKFSSRGFIFKTLT
jgi:hypothetical protein